MSTKEDKMVFVCGTCGNLIQLLDSLQMHLIFTPGCNKLKKNKQHPTCSCGKSFDSRSEWNKHTGCQGKKDIINKLFDKMVARDKDCYRKEMASVASRTPKKAKATPQKKTPSKKKGSKKSKKEKKKKEVDGSEESTISINSSEDSDTDSSDSSSEESTDSTSSVENSPSNKRKHKSNLNEEDEKNKKAKFFLPDDLLRQWQLMVEYSRPFDKGNPLHTLSQQSMSDLNIFEKPGCIAFSKTYSQAVNPFFGFGKREVLQFGKGDSRMFICRDINNPDSVDNLVQIITEQNPKIIKLWEEDKGLKEGIISSTPYFWVDTLVAPSGNLYGVYSLDNTLEPLSERDLVCVICLPFNVIISQEFIDLVTSYEPSMVPHYSSANADKKSWKGIALQGYTPNHADLHKPEEMSKDWQKKNSISGNKSYETDLQKTDLMVHFKYFLSQLKKAMPGKIHRVRVLALAPGGKISRHSDKPIQADLDRGKRIIRFHLPVVSNDKVKMRVWNLHGEMIEMIMQVGFVYILDNRKSHSVVNDGETTRHHIVFDVELTDDLEAIIARSFHFTAPIEDFEAKFNDWKESTQFTNIEFLENEEEKAEGEKKRIEKERIKEAKRLEKEEHTMEVEPNCSPSQHLFAHDDRIKTTFSISSEFNDLEEDEDDNSNYRLGKREKSNNDCNNNSPTAEEKKKEKKQKKDKKANKKKEKEASEKDYVTIDSDSEKKFESGDGFVATSLEEFLEHYSLSHLLETFRRSKLEDQFSEFHLLERADLKDMGFVVGDILLWKKYNPKLL